MKAQEMKTNSTSRKFVHVAVKKKKKLSVGTNEEETEESKKRCIFAFRESSM